MDIQKARPLRKQGFTHSKVTEKLNAILKDGSAYGIHTFVYASNYNGLIDILDNKLISEFDTRIALKGGESSKILGGSIFENVINNNGIALVKSPYTKYEIDKVKIYSL
jgi:hypothetical protein